MPVTPANAKMIQLGPIGGAQREPFLAMWDKLMQIDETKLSQSVILAKYFAGVSREASTTNLTLRVRVHPAAAAKGFMFFAPLAIAYQERIQTIVDSSLHVHDRWYFSIYTSDEIDEIPLGFTVNPRRWKQLNEMTIEHPADVLMMFACLRLQLFAILHNYDMPSQLPVFTRSAIFSMLPEDVQAAESMTASERREMERKQRKLDRIEEKRKREELIESIRRETENAIASSQRDEIQSMFNFFQHEADELTSSLRPHSHKDETLAKRDVRQQVATEIPPAQAPAPAQAQAQAQAPVPASDVDTADTAGNSANSEQVDSQAQADVEEMLRLLRSGNLGRQ